MTTPTRIWLTHGTDDPEPLGPHEPPWRGMLWAEEPICDGDVEYLRADTVAAMTRTQRELADCERMAQDVARALGEEVAP